MRFLGRHGTALLLTLLGCAEDAHFDLSVSVPGGVSVASVDVAICSARDRSIVLGRATISAGEPAVLTIPADGRAIGIAAVAGGVLCAASCQRDVEPGDVVQGEIVLSRCLPCGGLGSDCPICSLDPLTAQSCRDCDLQPSATEVCRLPLCFVDSSLLSLCP